MRENKIDMWIIMNREGNFDPLYHFLGEGYVGHTGYYIFTDTGKPRIERAVLESMAIYWKSQKLTIISDRNQS